MGGPDHICHIKGNSFSWLFCPNMSFYESKHFRLHNPKIAQMEQEKAQGTNPQNENFWGYSCNISNLHFNSRSDLAKVLWKK